MYEQREPGVEAEVTLLKTNEGGRACDVFTGFRPEHYVTDTYLTCGHHEYVGKEKLELGKQLLHTYGSLLQRCTQRACGLAKS